MKWPRASWSRPGRDLAPKAVQGRIFIDLASFLVDFGEFVGPFWMDFQWFLHEMCDGQPRRSRASVLAMHAQSSQMLGPEATGNALS